MNKEKEIFFGETINYYIPSNDINHNYIFDTCAINEIMKSEKYKSDVKAFKENGNNYYITDA